MTFKTRAPAIGHIGSFSTCEAALTFDAQGTNFTSGGQKMNGTFQITSSDGGEVWSSGKIPEGLYSNGNNNGEGSIELVADVDKSNSL